MLYYKGSGPLKDYIIHSYRKFHKDSRDIVILLEGEVKFQEEMRNEDPMMFIQQNKETLSF